MEPIFVTPDGDHGNRMVEAAVRVGARNLLVVSRGVDDGHFAERFGELCDLAAPYGIGCSIEFLAFMSVSSLGQSIDILDRANRPNGGVLIDSLHLARTGGTPADAASVAPARLAYAQLCDAPSKGPGDAYAGRPRRSVDTRRRRAPPYANSSTHFRRTRRSRWRSAHPRLRSTFTRCHRPSPSRPRHDKRLVRRRIQRRVIQRIGNVSPRVCQYGIVPPSTGNMHAVMFLAASDAINTATAATSSTLFGRLIADSELKVSISSS